MTSTPGRPGWPLLTGFALLASPALLTSGSLIQPDVDGSAVEQLATIDDALARWRISWVLVLLGATLAIPAALQIARLVQKPGEVSTLAGVIVTSLGAVALVCHAATKGMHGSQLAVDARDAALAPGAAESYDGLTHGILRFPVYGAETMAIGFIVLGVCLLARGPQPRFAGIVIAAGAAVVTAGIFVAIPWIAGAGAVVLLAGAVPFAFPRRQSAPRGPEGPAPTLGGPIP